MGRVIEENFPNLMKEMGINVQEAYRTPKKLDQKKKILLQRNIQITKCIEQRKDLKNCKGKRPSNIQSQTYQNYA